MLHSVAWDTLPFPSQKLQQYLQSQRWKFRLTHNPCPVSPSSDLGYGRQPKPHRILAASLCKPNSSSKTIWTCWFTKFVKWERWFHVFAQSETSPTNWPTYKTHSSQYPSRDCHAGRWAADAVARNGWWSGAGCCFQIWALPLPSRAKSRQVMQSQLGGRLDVDAVAGS